MSTLSTHVLDAVAGRPRVGVPVRLEHDGRERAAGRTDDDGRLRFAERLAAGVHRLVFEVDTPFYPEVVVTFRVAEDDEHLHVPVLLSPFSYTTYRGS